MKFNDKIIKMSKTESTEEIVDWIMELKDLEGQKGMISRVKHYLKRNL